MKRLTLVLFVIGLLALAGSASGGVLYSNGPANGQFEGWTINQGFSVSDSFTLSGPSTVTGFDFLGWNIPGDTAIAVDWSIGTTQFDNSLGSGTSGLTNVSDGANSQGRSLNEYTATGLSVALGAGTYWFTLQNLSGTNLTGTNGDLGYWDENSGPSAAFESSLGSLSGGGGYGCPGDAQSCTGSETFDINGTATTPEPGSLMLFGSGMLLLAGALRRKVSR